MSVQALDKSLAALEAGRVDMARGVEAALAEVEVNLSYINDILATGMRPRPRDLVYKVWDLVLRLIPPYLQA